MADTFENLAKLLSGRYLRVLIADMSVVTPAPVPANMADVFPLVGTKTPVTPWTDVGSIGDDFEYEREFEAEGFRIRERTAEIMREITESNRTLDFSLNEVTPENLKMFEQGASITTVAAATNKSAQKWIKAGTPDEFARYRVAFVGRRKASVAKVVEPGGVVRGAFVMGGFPLAEIAADGSSIEFGAEDLVSIPIQLQSVPDATLPAGADQVFWAEEQPGTILAA